MMEANLVSLREGFLNTEYFSAMTLVAPLLPIEQSEVQRQVAKYSGHSRRLLTGKSSA